MPSDLSLLGGVFIGLASAILLLGDGRVAGISGIASRAFSVQARTEGPWRLCFIGGLVVGALLLVRLWPQGFPEIHGSPLRFVFSGLLVGTGAKLANGCTSGHGVCGVARASKRSLTAVLIFMLFGAVAVHVLRSFA